MVAFLIRTLALLLALATIAAHGFAYLVTATRLRPFGGEVFGIETDQLLAVILAAALTSIQLLVPVELSRRGSDSWPSQIRGWLLTAILVIGHWILAVSVTAVDLTAPAMSSRGIAVLAAAELCAEIAVTLLQETAWRRGDPRQPNGARRAVEAEAPTRITARPLRPFEQRLLLHLSSLAGDSELVTTQAEIANALGCSKSTLNGALHGLAAAGAIHLVTTPRQTRVRLVGRSDAAAPASNRGMLTGGNASDIDGTVQHTDAVIDATVHHSDATIDVTDADLDGPTPLLPAIVRYSHFRFAPLFLRLAGWCVRACEIVRTLCPRVSCVATGSPHRWDRSHTAAGARSP